MGPGDMNIRASRSTGTPARPPKGGSSAWSRGRSSLRVTGSRRRSSRPRTSSGRTPAASSARRTRGAPANAWATVAASRAPRCALRASVGRASMRGSRMRPSRSVVTGSPLSLGGTDPARRASGSPSQPALPALVELHVAVALSASAAEIELLHVLVRPERVRLAVEDDAPVLHDVAVVGDPEREVRVLLDEEQARLLLAVHAHEDLEDLAGEEGGEPERRLVEEDEPGSRHERPPDGEHLLLAAGEVPRELAAVPAQRREVVEDEGVVALQAGAVAAGVAAHHDVLVDGEVLEDAASLHHLEDAAADDLLGREPVDACSVELDGAVGDLALLGVEEIRDRLQGRRLPGAVRSEERDDLAAGDLERESLQHQDHVVVDDLDVLQARYGQPLAPPARGGARVGGGGGRSRAPASRRCAAWRSPRS